MEEVSAQQLNDSLLKLDLFKCKHCLQILKPPVMYVSGLGNTCISCVKTYDYKNIVQNIEIEAAISKLVVPCRFEKNGCTLKCKGNYMKQHESECSYHNIICPYTHFNECITESVTNIVDHFEEVHTHSIIITETDTVKLCFHINTPHNQLNLLVIKNEKFLVRIVYSSEDDKIFYLVYYMGNMANIDKFQCNIEHMGENTRINTIALILHDSVLHETYTDSFWNKSQATSFDMSLIREIFNQNINVSIKIVTKDSVPLPDSYEKLLICFECPVCNGFMRPPIYQCLAGHSICNKCKSKVNNCPTCRSNYGSTRNYILENLSSSIKYPCIFRELGCERYFSVDTITQHENECILKPFNCPFFEYLHCAWNGSLNNVPDHLKKTHPQLTINDNLCTENIDYSNDKQYFQMKCLLAYGKVFRVCHQRHIGNNNGYWAVQVIGPKGEGKKYTCHIAILDPRNLNRTMLRTDLCQDITTQDSMFNQCIVIPLNVVSWFTSNGQLQFYYKIVNCVKQ